MSDSTIKPVAYECKHASYIPAVDGSEDDAVVIKQLVHYPDGSTKPELLVVENYKREFYVTRPNFRNHEEKKEWEDLQRLQRYETTQAKLQLAILRALGKPPVKNSGLRRLLRSPYVYGCDISTPTLIKNYYMNKRNAEGKRWGDYVTPNSIAVFDSETDMDTGEILMLAITQKEKARLTVRRSFFPGMTDEVILERLNAAFHKYLGEVVEKRNINLEIELVDREVDTVLRTFDAAHTWKPDILAAWNIDFDIPRVLEALARGNVDPADVFCDPKIPTKYRWWEYRQGPAQKVTASGKSFALQPAERWHRLSAPASWYLLDPMCVYYRMRIAAGKDPSYSLDAILQKHLGIRKLKFKEADHVKGGDWHKFMQKHYPVEYCIYNLFDCISVEILDEETTDLALMVSSLCGHSEFQQFASQPRRLWDDLYFEARAEGKVTATTSDQMEHELDEHVVGLDNWIVTLDSYLVKQDGLKIVEENPDYATMVYAHTADLDVEGTYPNEEIIFNISKETTYMEMAAIEYMSEAKQRAMGINLTGGYVNAVEICRDLMGAPGLDELLKTFQAEQAGLTTPATVVDESVPDMAL